MLQVFLQRANSHCTIAFICTTVALTFGYVLYLVVFHPLAKVKGPFWGKINPFYHVMLVKTGKRHKHLKELHDKYGDFVRVGPNAVSICNVDAQKDIFGPSSTVIKSPGYDAFRENAAHSSLNNARDKTVHQQLKKSLGPGFSHQSLAKLEFLVAQNALYFCESVLKFGNNGENALNLTTWTSFFTYDVMGDLCFGESYDLMKNGNMASLVLFATAPLKLAGLALASPFLATFNALISPKSLREGLALFRKDYNRRIDNRLANPSGRKDFMHYMIGYANMAETEKDRRGRLQSNTETLLLAGAGTTATSLSATIWYLVQHPHVLSKLREHLDVLTDVEITNDRLANIPYLEAVIDETLRICPPVPGAIPRDTTCPTVIAGVQFPQGVEVTVPTWAICRDSRYFTNPDEWIPERWIDVAYEKDQTIGRAAWKPFSLGPRGCIGRNLAYMEARLGVAHWVRKLDFAFVEPNGSYEVADFTVAERSELLVNITPRSFS